MTHTPDSFAFIAFTLGPVQSFISAARSVRDLWTGSYLLSWLTYQAMLPIIKEYGEEAIVAPSLIDNPLHRLYQAGGQIEDVLQHDRILAPCLPNRFLASVPDSDEVHVLARATEENCESRWRTLFNSVRHRLDSEMDSKVVEHREGWDRWWHQQCEGFFEVRSVAIRGSNCDDATINELFPSSSDASTEDLEGLRWAKLWQVTERLLRSRRSVRHMTSYRLSDSEVPQKCSLLGTYEQMGPHKLNESRAFWSDVSEKVRLAGSRVESSERLSALGLVKRFAWPGFFSTKQELGIVPEARRSEDTATVAAKHWLQAGKVLDPSQQKVWSGQWLHWDSPLKGLEAGDPSPRTELWNQIQDKKKEQGSPPIYYAVLMMDGDRMGKWFRGSASDCGESRHRLLSRILTRFAIDTAPSIVEKEYGGKLIYAGGDDVLAMLPAATVLACARKLAVAFHQAWPQQFVGTAESGPTMSAGIAVVHFKEDLRFSLRAAREAEKLAKASSRNALALSICRRSGVHSSSICSWPFCERLQSWVHTYATTADSAPDSDRWAYHLAAEISTLEGLPLDAVKAEISRRLDRTVAADDSPLSRRALLNAFEDHVKFIDTTMQDQSAIRSFVTLCLAAAFMSRSKEG